MRLVERAGDLMGELEGPITRGLVTIDHVEVVKYAGRSDAPG